MYDTYFRETFNPSQNIFGTTTKSSRGVPDPDTNSGVRDLVTGGFIPCSLVGTRTPFILEKMNANEKDGRNVKMR